MLERLITPQISAEVIGHLLANGWSVRRIARVTRAPVDFVRRTLDEKHCLLVSDLNALAAASGSTAHRLVFDSMPFAKLSPEMQKLRDITEKDLEMFRRVVGHYIQLGNAHRPTEQKVAEQKAAE